MSKHTPGPWKVSRRFDIYQDPGSHGGTYIGSTRGNGLLPPSVEAVDEANARLIADAPWLLNVLRSIIDDLPTNRDWLDPNYEAEARELIAKHAGE